MHAIKRLKNKTITIIITVAIAVSLIFGAFSFARTAAHADTEDTTEFVPTSLGLSNTQFDSSSGSYPAKPSSWSDNVLGGEGAVKAGVIDLTPSAYFGEKSGNKEFKLDQYKEFSEETAMPKTIFGESSKLGLGGDAKTLMINTEEGAELAYAYTSGDMTFAPNSFYRISAWVKTGNFASDTGATIKLTGLGQNCSFLNINTVRKPNEDKYEGWVQYTFYVRTSASYSKTVNLVLGIGDVLNSDEEDPKGITPSVAHGYAFFDTVEADRISAHDFAADTQHFTATDVSNVYLNYFGNSMAIDLYELDSLTVGDKEIGTFSENFNEWEQNIYYDENSSEKTYAGNAKCFTYDSESISNLDYLKEEYGLTKNPWAPYGRAEYSNINNPMFVGSDDKIMMISTYDGSNKFQSAAYGVASPYVTIERYKYYRFGVWVKDDSIEGGSISVAIKGKAAGASKVATLNKYSDLKGDSSDTAHYGWKEHVIYLKGSNLTDYTVKFELWLGSPSSLAKGIAMFDNVTFTEISYTQYNGMSEADGGNMHSFDSDNTDTGVTNGNFSMIGDLTDDKLSFPLPVAEWSYLTPDKVETRGGFATNEVNTDNAVHGILPTDNETFNTISQSRVIPGVSNPSGWYKPLNTVLLLSSTTPTAYCYQSPSITLSTDKASKLTVTLAVDGVTKGNGGALVLKTTDGDVISTIENIGKTEGFKTYTFYLAAPLSEQTLYLEIWLGLNDRYNNSTKLSNGNIYVREVAMSEWTSDTSVTQEYAEKLAEYKEAIRNTALRDSLDFGIYSFSTISLDYYDIYDYANSDGLGKLYQWSSSAADSNTSKSGMFNADYMKNLTVYDGFDSKGLSGNMLYIFNTAANRTTYTYNNALSLVANMYYRIDVQVKVRISDEIRTNDNAKQIGANIKLTGTSAEFTNIKDTTSLVSKYNEDSRDYEAFQTYTFYISTGESGGSIGMEISLGGNDAASQIQGKLVIGGITMSEIDNIAFEDAQKDTSNKRITTVELSEANTDDDNNTEAVSSGEIQWWVIPTVIFSTALIAVIAIIVVVRLRERIKRNRKVTYSSEYDRSDVMKDIERLQKAKDNANAEQPAELEASNDDDNDDNEPVEAEEQKVEEEQPEEQKEQPQEKETVEENLDD